MRNLHEATHNHTFRPALAWSLARRVLLAGALAAALIGCSPVDAVDCPPGDPAAQHDAVDVAALGASESELALRDTLVGQLEDVVAPQAVAERARLVVVRLGNAVLADPVVLADIDFSFDDTGNPELGRKLAEACTRQLIDEVNNGIDQAGYSQGSDPSEPPPGRPGSSPSSPTAATGSACSPTAGPSSTAATSTTPTSPAPTASPRPSRAACPPPPRTCTRSTSPRAAPGCAPTAR